MIDGAKGEPVTIEGKPSEIGTTLGHAMEQPIATSRIETKLEGRKLRVKLAYGDEPTASVEGKFVQPSEYASIKEILVYFSK